MDLITMLKADEAFRALVYDDATGRPIQPGTLVKGHPTIGFGLALDTDGISQSEAEYLLANRVGTAVRAAAADLGDAWYKLDTVRQAALANLAYQMGGRGLAAFQNMLASIRVGDWQRAHDEALASRWAQQTPLRAQRIAKMLLTGSWPEEAK